MLIHYIKFIPVAAGRATVSAPGWDDPPSRLTNIILRNIFLFKIIDIYNLKIYFTTDTFEYKICSHFVKMLRYNTVVIPEVHT